MARNAFYSLFSSEGWPILTSDPAHVLHRYDMGLRAKFCPHMSHHLGVYQKHMLLTLNYLVDMHYLFVLMVFDTAVKHLLDDTFKSTVHRYRFIVAVGIGNTKLHVLVNTLGCVITTTFTGHSLQHEASRTGQYTWLCNNNNIHTTFTATRSFTYWSIHLAV